MERRRYVGIHVQARNFSDAEVLSQFYSTCKRISPMKKVSIIAVAILVGSSAICYAGSKNGASGGAPGTQMNNTSGSGRGASEFSPGDQMKDRTTTGSAKGASEFSPGDRMNDARNKPGKQ
jgi:hypothetical protein